MSPPAEVEDILHRHPAIRQAVVVGVPDTRLMEVACAFVILNDGQVANEDGLLAWAREHMASFKAPRYVRIVESFELIGMTAKLEDPEGPIAQACFRVVGFGVMQSEAGDLIGNST